MREHFKPERGDHVHSFGNTHYWLDPENARPITARILEALTRLVPADRAYFESRRAAFLKRLDAGLKRWTDAMAPYRGTKVVVVHESWPYFARRFGLQIVAAVEPVPGVPPSPAYLATLTRHMKDAHVRVLIAEPYSSAALVARVASLGGARAVTLVASVILLTLNPFVKKKDITVVPFEINGTSSDPVFSLDLDGKRTISAKAARRN